MPLRDKVNTQIDTLLTDWEHTDHSVRSFLESANKFKVDSNLLDEVDDFLTQLKNLKQKIQAVKDHFQKQQYTDALRLIESIKFNYHNVKEGENWMRPSGDLIRKDRIEIFSFSQEVAEAKSKLKKDLKQLSKDFPQKIAAHKATLYSIPDGPLPPSESTDTLFEPAGVKLNKQLIQPLLEDTDSLLDGAEKKRGRSPTSGKQGL